MKTKLTLALLSLVLAHATPARAGAPKLYSNTSKTQPAPTTFPGCGLPIVKKAWFCNASKKSQQQAPKPMQPSPR